MRKGGARGFSIRTKLLLVGLALLLIPWMGYQYVREMKSFLLQGQENALSLTARAVSTVLHDRPEFFDPEQGAKSLGNPNDLFAYPLPDYIRLDGVSDDWGDLIEQAQIYDGSVDQQCPKDQDIDTLNFRHILGYRGPYLYGLFEVNDDVVVFRDRKLRRLDNSDHLRVLLEDPAGRINRYLLTAQQPGRMSVYLMDEKWTYPLTGDPNYDIAAEWQTSDTGYVVELRIPRFLVSSQTRVGFTVVDVDDTESRQRRGRIHASLTQDESEPLNRLLIHSPEIAKILRGLNRPAARIWVLDKQQRVRAVVGQLYSDPGEALPPTTVQESLKSWYENLLHSIYESILETRSLEITDISTDVSHRNDEALRKAQTGIPQTHRRPSLDGRTEILMAAHPVWSGDQILGVVVAEQSSSEVLFHEKQVLENVISITLLVLVIIAAALLFFASRITIRISRLRNATDKAISKEGKVLSTRIEAESKSGDEIGDLSRSVSNMLGRLANYTKYLESLPDTLAHEMSNPLNVVNSSLENLQKEQPSTEQSKYMQRAQNGIQRLRSILTNLTEAANLEDALRTEEQEEFDLVHLVSSYVEGYRYSHPERQFELDIRAEPLMIQGVPDHIAQMLDKLADNAVDFGDENTPIKFLLEKVNGTAELQVLNQGPELPEVTTDQLFDPMISVGKKNAQQSRLGLGLYVVRLIAQFHRGNVTASNRSDTTGAKFTVSLPLAQS